MPEANATSRNRMTTSATLAIDTVPTAGKACRFCGAGLQRTFVDLGMSPLCETYPSAADLNCGEVYYPLHVYVCEKCCLVQLEEYETRRTFSAITLISPPTLTHGSNIARNIVKNDDAIRPGKPELCG